MRVSTCENSMLFIEPSARELESIINKAARRDTIKEPKGLRVYGTPEQLYMILHKLSFEYDLEL